MQSHGQRTLSLTLNKLDALDANRTVLQFNGKRPPELN